MMGDTNRVIFDLTDHLEYYDELKKKGEKAKVCKAFEDHYKSGVEEGKQLGIEQGIEQGKQLGMEQGRKLEITEGIRALIETCRKFSISRNDTRNSIISQFQIPEESAERYMAKYWQ